MSSTEPGASRPGAAGKPALTNVRVFDGQLTSLDAWRAATVLPACYFALEDRGVVEPGRRADLVLIDGDPLQDIRATRWLRHVWCGGIEHELAD